ncbi:hypothetical protein [Halalkalibacter hemicellulosilyticus]|uniref:Uncharacterized protein n=1 Tax=Halalkalibacter hemicellulosilyticusJCM 9152 TaxID=1236971 RepID=W4QJ47_9BACI|nr:hypothetical protein [Halalkalibacter hemicellulosilyticus]GAE31912.1 hypothetical protein JCM9152_3412 [Halalkalibacter hemicellulosilyticusJCM 9152]
MTLSVYYNEIDGHLYPQWLLLNATMKKEFVSYSINPPFERFHSEDFHDSMSILSVSQGALLRDPVDRTRFSIHIPTVVNDAINNGSNINSIYNASHFLIQIEELEEFLQMNVREQL